MNSIFISQKHHFPKKSHVSHPFWKPGKHRSQLHELTSSAIGDGDGALTAPEFLICCERLMGPSKAGPVTRWGGHAGGVLLPGVSPRFLVLPLGMRKKNMEQK